MHPNRIYRGETEAKTLAFARDRAFGTLSINADAGPLMAHVPFLLSQDGAVADMHLVRSNPIFRALDVPQRAVIAVLGPDGYVSPDWYESANQVPTWNYVAVHLRGTLERRPDEEMRALLVRQSAAYEERLLPKAPWLIDKVDDAALARLMRAIAPVRLTVESVDGTWKLSQNKDAADRAGVVDAIESGIGIELAALAGLMRQTQS